MERLVALRQHRVFDLLAIDGIDGLQGVRVRCPTERPVSLPGPRSCFRSGFLRKLRGNCILAIVVHTEIVLLVIQLENANLWLLGAGALLRSLTCNFLVLLG